MAAAYEAVLQVFASGRVQGVWYRSWTVENAIALGLDGWVRNRRDGRVEAVLAGAEAAVQEMLGRMRQGPPAAAVEDLATQPWSGKVEPGFRQVASA